MEENFAIGTISSSGIALGKIYCITPQEQVQMYSITEECVEDEKQRLLEARKQVSIQLNELIQYTIDKFGKDQAELFKAHLMLFEDDDFESEILDKITRKLYNAEYAVDEFIEETCQDMLQLDEYFQERVSDFQDLGRRLVATLQNKIYNDYKDINDTVIIFAHDLTPSITTQLNVDLVAGFVTETGGITSHVSFIAQNLGIPAIVGAKNILSHVTHGDDAIIDAVDKHIIIKPSKKTRDIYLKKAEKYQQNIALLLKNTSLPATTTDGHTITLLANIGGEKDLDAVKKYGAEGIGLFRTEFLFMGVAPPSEEKQFGIYKLVLASMENKPVTIRTLDIGGDKQIPFLTLPKEDNPFLGYRALRIYAEYAKIIEQQIRAILRASAFGIVRIMIPMVISIAEVEWVKQLIGTLEKKLIEEGYTIGEYFVGIMVETPSVAILSDLFIDEVDFFSIGTNDLIQYTLAVDRGNETISDLYQPFHPAIIRLLRQIINSANEAHKSVSVCGDMGGDEHAVLLLLGLGLKKISMSPSKIPLIKNMICRINLEKLQKDIINIHNVGKIKEVRELLESCMQKVLETN